jgi:hypothetical protein
MVHTRDSRHIIEACFSFVSVGVTEKDARTAVLGTAETKRGNGVAA